MSNPRIKRKIILAKSETEYGEDPTPTLPVRAFDISDITVEYNSYFARTQDRSIYQGAYPGDIIKSLNFKTFLTRALDDSTEHMLSVLLKACYWKHSNSTLNKFDTIGDPVASGNSVTLYLYNDGVLEKLVGARGTATVHIEAGQVPYVEFTFTGLYESVGADDMPVVSNDDYTEGELFSVRAVTLEINSDPYHSRVLEFSDGNTVNPIPSSTAENGVALIGVPETDPRGNIEYLVNTENANTIEALIDNSTPVEISFINIDYPNLAITFNASIFERPSADVAGYSGWNLGFVITGGVDIDLTKPPA